MNLGKESEFIEFKESLEELDAGIRSISAMLNRHKEALVYFGVKDTGDIKGLLLGDNTLMKIKEKIKNKIKPMILPEIKILEDGDKKYIEVKVSATTIPYSYDGRYYVRNQASDEQVEPHLLSKMFLADGTDVISERKAKRQDLTFDYLMEQMKKHNIHIDDVDKLCENYKLKDKNGFYNETGFLLSDQNDYIIKVIKFNGIDKVDMHDKKDFTNQSLLKSMQEIIEYVNIFNTNKVDLSVRPRKETPLFDKDAYKEAVINAFVHNDWKRELPPAVFMYDDRLEVFSYGELPYFLDLEAFYSGKSMPINEALFKIFLINEFSEQSGHGVPTIVKNYGKDAFDLSSSTITVTIRYNFKLNDSSSDNQAKAQRNPKEPPKKAQRNPKEIEILNAIEDDTTITVSEIAKTLGYTIDSVQHYINKLKEKGVIAHTGSTKGGRWEILKDK